jgi:recombination protein RecR
MGLYPPPLEKLIKNLSRLPGIGQKSATRVAMHILNNKGDLAESLAESLMEVKEKIRLCPVCFNFTESEPCSICGDPNRVNGILCVVEGPADQLAIEESGIFKGRYHVLHGVLSPLDGIGPENLRIGELLARLEKESINEIILATNPTTQGEATASYLGDLLSDRKIRISRIALGVPMGSDLKYMDPLTLGHSFKGRTPVVS